MHKNLKVEVTELAYQTFLDISVPLTGFSKNELLATGMHETYYYTLMKDPDQDNVRAFFKEAQEIMNEYGNDETKMNAEIAKRLVPMSKYVELARRIILVWYTGVWNDMVKTDKGWEAVPHIISSDSYSEGLIWTAAETHPAGARQPGYGSWAIAPLS